MHKIITALTFLACLPLHAIQPQPYYVVADDYIAPHMLGEHEKALLDFKQRVDKHGYQGSWRFYQFDDGRHVAFSAQQSHDYASENDKKWAEAGAKFDPEFLQSNSAVYQQTITNQDYFLMRYSADLSNEPAKTQGDAVSHLVWLEIQLHRKPARESLKAWVAEQKAAEEPFYFSSYSKQYGANLPTIYIAIHVPSFAQFYSRLNDIGTHDPLSLLPEKFKQAVQEYHVSLARYIPQVSY